MGQVTTIGPIREEVSSIELNAITNLESNRAQAESDRLGKYKISREPEQEPTGEKNEISPIVIDK